MKRKASDETHKLCLGIRGFEAWVLGFIYGLGSKIRFLSLVLLSTPPVTLHEISDLPMPKNPALHAQSVELQEHGFSERLGPWDLLVSRGDRRLNLQGPM